MAEFGFVETKQLKLPGAGNTLYRRDVTTGLLLPASLVMADIPGAAFGKSLLVTTSATEAKTLLEVGGGGGEIGQSSFQVFYGSTNPATVVNEVYTIPAWAKRYRFRLHGSGSGSNSGSVAGAGAVALGGATGGAGFSLNIEGSVSELLNFGNNSTTLNIFLGPPGQGGAATTTTTVNNGSAGSAASISINSQIFCRALGGTAPTSGTNGGLNTLSAAALAPATTGGVAGANGVNSSSSGSGGTTGNTSNTLNQAASGGSGGGISSTTNTASNGGQGNKGGIVNRNANEVIPSATTPGTQASRDAVDVTPITIGGIPVPGNSPGGGASALTGNGGRGGHGTNGSSGGGGGGARTGGSSGPGGNGGRSFAVIEFFGSEVGSITEVPKYIPGGRISVFSGNPTPTSGTATQTLYYLPYLHAQAPLWDGTKWVNYTIPNAGLSLDISSLGVGSYELFLDFNGVNPPILAAVKWQTLTSRGTNVQLEIWGGYEVQVGNRGRLSLGGFYVKTAGFVEVGAKLVGYSNRYNRVSRAIQAIETTASWKVTVAFNTWESWGNRSGATTAGNNNRIELFNIDDIDPVILSFMARISSAVDGGAQIGIGLDTNTGPTSLVAYTTLQNDVPYIIPFSRYVGSGLHFLQPVQMSVANTGATFLSNSGCGLEGAIMY